LVMQDSYVFSGKEEDLDLLLLKAESEARRRWCYLTELDEEGAAIRWWEFEEFFSGGMWRERTDAISHANWKAMSAEAYYDCIVSCLGPTCSCLSCKNKLVIVGLASGFFCKPIWPQGLSAPPWFTWGWGWYLLSPTIELSFDRIQSHSGVRQEETRLTGLQPGEVARRQSAFSHPGLLDHLPYCLSCNPQRMLYLSQSALLRLLQLQMLRRFQALPFRLW
jgi:hypothetical protein